MKVQHAESDLGFIDRLHKKGVTWLILFVVFLAADPSNSFLYKLLNSVAFLMEVMLLVTFVNKVLIRYLLARQKIMIFILEEHKTNEPIRISKKGPVMLICFLLKHLCQIQNF